DPERFKRLMAAAEQMAARRVAIYRHLAKLTVPARHPAGRRRLTEREEASRYLLGLLARVSVLLVPGLAASILLHLPLLLAAVDPVPTRVLAFLLRVARIVSPLLSGFARVVPILSTILAALHPLGLCMAVHGRDQQGDRNQRQATTDRTIHARPPSR